MDEYMKKQLREGEKVLWNGAPKNIQLMEPPYNTSNMVKWISAIAGFVLIGLYIWYTGVAELDMQTTMIVSGLFGLAMLYLIIQPFLSIRRLQNSYQYYITNERAIIYKKGMSPKMDWRDFSDVAESTVDITANKHGNIFIGPKTRRAYTHVRSEINENNREEVYLTEPIVFVSVENPMEVCRFLPEAVHVK